MAEEKRVGDETRTPLEVATEKGYWGADPSPAAAAETREADQTKGGPVLVDEERSPVSGERTDVDADGVPVDAPEAAGGSLQVNPDAEKPSAKKPARKS